MELCFSKSTLVLLVFFVVPFISAAKTKSPACNFPAIFNLGDSNSDTGGLSAAFGQLGPPFGETYFGEPVGRYSDGRLIIDFIAESLKLPHLSPFLDALDSNFSHGANFATAGSTIRPQNTTLHQSGFSPISLNVQIKEFNDFHRRSKIIRSKGNNVSRQFLPEEKDFSEGLYTVDIGQNDLTAGYFLNITDQDRDFVPELMDQFKTVIQDIYDNGGRYFWIHNTGPLGCLPFVLNIKDDEVDKAGCASPFNKAAQYFNSKLKETVVQLRKDLPLASLTYVDVYSVKYELISNARQYGFAHPLIACCGYGGEYNINYACGSKIIVEGEEIFVGSCKNPSVRINWDGAHYTEAANKWIFERIVNGAYSDPPLPLNMACYKEKEPQPVTLSSICGRNEL